MKTEIPALYEVAKNVCHELGLPWIDPRSGKTYPAPKHKGKAEVFTRHSANCEHKAQRYYRDCRCRKWVYVFGTRRRISAKTRSWERAERLREQIENGGPTKLAPSKPRFFTVFAANGDPIKVRIPEE